MLRGLYISAAGMLPRKVQQENTVANNLANISTIGYKKSSIFLRKLIGASYILDHALGKDNSQPPEEIRIDFSQGTFEKTDNPFDIALNGPGFFRVQDASGKLYYTRNGQFNLDGNGNLVNTGGFFLLDDQKNKIRIDGNDVKIMGNGHILIDEQLSATIGTTDFKANDYTALESLGMELFRKPASVSEIPTSSGTVVMQGFLEESNVDSIRTMVDMVDIFRSFESGQKAILIQDQALQRVVNEVGTVR
jgi:flagellar basal-body rod protein FlgF